MTNPTLLCPEGHIVDKNWLERKDKYGTPTFHSCCVTLPIANDAHVEEQDNDDFKIVIGKTHLEYQIFSCWTCCKPYWEYQCTEEKSDA